MADGAHRSFDAIQIKTQVDSETLRSALSSMVSNGSLEVDSERVDGAYVITLKGLIEQEDYSLPPLYRP